MHVESEEFLFISKAEITLVVDVARVSQFEGLQHAFSKLVTIIVCFT